MAEREIAHRGARPRRGRGRDGRARARRPVEDVQLRIYEPPRFFEAFLRGRALHRAARHHRAHLRHLPGRLPDERGRGDGGRLRRGGRRPDPGAAAAAVLRRVDREPRAARLHAPRARLPRLPERGRDGARPPRDRRAARCELKKAGNAIDARRRRPRDPPGQRPRRRLLPRAHARRARAGGRRSSSGRASSPARPCAAPRRCRSPTSRRTTSSSRCATPTTTRSRAGGSSRAPASTSRPREYDEHFVEEQVPHSTALHSRLRDGDALPRRPDGPLRAQPRRLSPVAREAADAAGLEAGVPQPVPQHRRARGGDPLRARRGAAADRRLRAAGPAGVEVAPARRRRATAGPRRRAGCSATATRSTTTARSSTRGSCRRPRRTRAASSRACTASSQQHVDAGRRRAQPALRAGGAQLRPVHLVRDALPATGDRPRVTSSSASATRGAATTAPASPSPGACASWRPRRRGARGRGRRDGAGDVWSGAEHVVVVDAARSGAAAGHRPALRRPLAARCRCAACAPRRTPSGSRTPSSWRDRWAACRARLEVYAIEGASFVAGDRLSPSVERAVAEVAGELGASRR